jgi:Ca2+:H+ antiporter
MIAFTLFDFYVLGPYLNFSGISSKPVIFAGGILSTVPLAYFIGMAVSSITAHTGSVAIGAVINATFGSIIEIILYAFGLMQGKEELVQGAMIGSFLLGLLALPGVSMFSGGLARTEQRFNAKSATVTSTMLVVSVIGVFTPTIFQNIHGTYQYDCKDCPNPISLDEIIIEGNGRACRSCRIYQPHPTEDPIYQKSTKPLMYICTIVLLLTYAVGLFFTLGTHAKHIYPQNPKKKKKRKIVTTQQTDVPSSVVLEHHNNNTVLLRPHKQKESKGKQRQNVSTLTDIDQSSACSSDDDANVHESPGWNIFISAGVLLTCTILYTLIAEVLIDCLDIIIEEFQMSEKILGLTIFAIVPTVTEFCIKYLM